MRLRFAPTASRDLAGLLACIASQDERIAETVAVEIRDTLKRIETQPKIGTATSARNTLRHPTRRSKIAIFYRVFPRKQEIVVMRIVRGGRVRDLRRAPRG